MKKLFITTALLVALAISTGGQAATVKCKTNEFKAVSTGQCTKCPANAKCDGTSSYVCNAGYMKENTIKDGGIVKCIAIPKCKKNQYLVSGKCAKCPANATCNGEIAKCKPGYEGGVDRTTGALRCIAQACTKTQYLVLGKCTSCPKNATCDGKTATCKPGYGAVTVSNTGELLCDPRSCAKNAYLAGNVCKACPAHATCDGKTATCKPGYRDVAKNIHGAVCESTCKTTEYLVGGRCVACPKGATCDGETPKCSRGYTKDKNGYITCK